jgi:sulfoquinovose isomerase
MPAATTTQPWRNRPYHRRWLLEQADGLFGFFQKRAFNPKGGFFDLTPAGEPAVPNNPVRGIHSTARMVHCFAIGSLMGRPGSDLIVDHGMKFLWEWHRDTKAGGYFWTVDDNGPRDGRKQGYGHAFVLLASSSAKLVGHPLADKMLADVTEILETKFWEEQHGAIAEEFNTDWSPIAPYHGQNSNMHLTEALMAAFEATGESSYLDKAERIADLIIRRKAGENGFRVAEHFDGDWVLDKGYLGDPMFRPPGTTPGHWLEWSRLVLQLWCWAASSMPGCRMRPRRCSRNPSRWAGTRRRAGSSTTSTGTTSRTCCTSCGGRPRRASAPRRSSANTGRAPSTRNGTATSGT